MGKKESDLSGCTVPQDGIGWEGKDLAAAKSSSGWKWVYFWNLDP